MDLSELRAEYAQANLNREDLHDDPQKQFEFWFEQAEKAQLQEPNAMVLATVDDSGQPFTRTVLLKNMDARGLVFYTNYKSRKAEHMEANNRVSLLFLWLPLERQISINGTVEKVSTRESLTYFASRPLKSRLGAWASNQSEIITSRSLLEGKMHEMKRKFADGKIPLPSFWGGYRVIPQSWEFWQGRRSRLHDRFLYEKINDSWEIKRLSP